MTATAKRRTRAFEQVESIALRNDVLNALLRFLHRAATRYLVWNRSLMLDPQLRYHPVVALLNRRGTRIGDAILDIGSGSAGLAYFSGRPVVGVDVELSREESRRVRSPIVPVRASAVSLPFRDRSFDVVVSMDTLEHLSPAARPDAVAEAFRVARSLVVLGFPYGEATAEFERDGLRDERLYCAPTGWRDEHVRHGVPGRELHDVIAAIASRLPGTRLQWFGHEGLLGARIRWKTRLLVPRGSRSYGLVFYPLYWIHMRGWRRRAYRRVYVATIEEPRSAEDVQRTA